MIPRKLRASEVTFSIRVEEDHIPIEGNAMVSGDPAVDAETNAWVLTELAHGNVWAWASVLVTATWEGHEGFASLGAVSWEEKGMKIWHNVMAPLDFLETYGADLESEALDSLNEAVASAAKKIGALL